MLALRPSSGLTSLLLLLCFSPASSAQIVVANGSVRLERYESRVRIEDGLLRATVREVFANSESLDNSVYLFHAGASGLRDVRVTVNGSVVPARVLEREEAQTILADIDGAASQHERADENWLRADIPSMAAHARLEIELTYAADVVPPQFKYREPLGLCREWWGRGPQIAIEVDVVSRHDLGRIATSTPVALIARLSERHARVTFASSHAEDQDWELVYSLHDHYRGPADVVPPNLPSDGDRQPPGIPGGSGTPGATGGGRARNTSAGSRIGSGSGAAAVGRGQRTAEPDDATRAEMIVIAIESSDEPQDPVTIGTPVTLRARNAAGEIVGHLPLEHTDVTAQITGFLASTTVRQRFANTFDEPIEAVYVFPLPHSAAVHDFTMAIGERRIVGLIRPRVEAERIYAAARAQGQTASLLTQERTNIFTQSVANIEPHGSVEVAITYSHSMRYDSGQYEYVLPMVVESRYVPGTPVPRIIEGDVVAMPPGGGTSPNTDRVADASRISPPLLKPGERSGHDVSLQIDLDAGFYLRDVRSPTHQVSVEPTGVDRVRVRLTEADVIANRDFVLRYAIAGERIQLGMLAHRSAGGDGFFTLMMVPPLNPADVDVMPREITFIVDSSGSMSGLPIEMSKDVVRRTLLSLRPLDRFNIIQFAGGTSRLAEAPLANTPDNIARGLAYLASFQGAGGTEMLRAVERYLATEADPTRMRIVCFLTDGCVGNENEILAAIRDRGQSARWFAFGIGSSVNRMLIDGIAHFGNGASTVVLPRERGAGERAVAKLFSLIDAPVLVDVSVDFGTLPVTDVFPARPRDLFVGQPVTIIGRYSAPAIGEVTLRGRVGTRLREFSLPINLPDVAPAHGVLGPVWARAKVAELSERMLGRTENPTIVADITKLALQFKLVTAFTSFVAVDASRIVGDGQPLRILQPVAIPEGVSREGIEGRTRAGLSFRIEKWGLELTETSRPAVTVSAVSSEGATASIQPGDELVSIDRTAVRDLAHLESLLLQTPGPRVTLRFRSAGEVVLPRP